MSKNRLQSLTFDTWISTKSNFSVSLIGDCLLTLWVQLMHFSDCHTYSLVLFPGI